MLLQTLIRLQTMVLPHGTNCRHLLQALATKTVFILGQPVVQSLSKE